jgi:tRNA(Arg) A34 adenosine deaminase TadA
MNLRKLAEKSDHRLFKHVVIVEKGSRVISVGVNSGPEHAEIAAMRKAKRILPSLKGCTVRSYMFKVKSGVPGPSKPCAKCDLALRQEGIRRVFYSEFGSQREVWF